MRKSNPTFLEGCPPILALALLVKLSFFLSFDLGVDEAHYMLYARHLDWSYFDHPPLVGWFHWLWVKILGESLWAARLPVMVLGFIQDILLYRLLLRLGFSSKVATFATLATSWSLVFFVLNLFLLPDSLVCFLTICLAHLLLDFETHYREKNEKPLNIGLWIKLGLLLGLIGLSKYSGAFLVLPVLVFLLILCGPTLFLSRGFWLTGSIALFLISPVLVWNHQHDWLSFLYHFRRHSTDVGRGLAGLAQAVGTQAAGFGFLLWPLALWGLGRVFPGGLRFQMKALENSGSTELSHPNFLFGFVATFVILFLGYFTLSAFKTPPLPHWYAPAYVLALPLGLAFFMQVESSNYRWTKTYGKISLILQMVLLTGLSLSTAVGLIQRHFPLVFRDVLGWPRLMGELSKICEGENTCWLIFDNWTYGSRALFYGSVPKGGLNPDQIWINDDRTDQFDLWIKGALHERIKNQRIKIPNFLVFVFIEQDPPGSPQSEWEKFKHRLIRQGLDRLLQVNSLQILDSSCNFLDLHTDKLVFDSPVSVLSPLKVRIVRCSLS